MGSKRQPPKRDKPKVRHSAHYWSAPKVIEAIHALREGKNSGYVRKHHAALYNAALRIFGDWKSAIKAAGLDYYSIRRGWLKEDDQ